MSNSLQAKTDDSDRLEDLERTIRVMQESFLCADPSHGHSFQTLSTFFTMGAFLKQCAVCQQRLPALIYITEDNSKHVVKCLACGIHAHRTCATGGNRTRKLAFCEVNREKINTAMTQRRTDAAILDLMSDGDLCLDGSEEVVVFDDDDDGGEQAVHEEKKTSDSPHTNAFPPQTGVLQWTPEGPPKHWSTTSSSPLVQSIAALPTGSAASKSEGASDEATTPLHYAKHPFASVSRALQENILAALSQSRKAEGGSGETSLSDGKNTEPKASGDASQNENNNDNDEDGNYRPRSLANFASGTYEAVRTSINVPRRIGVASVAGGVAGGIAGLAIAGPAGAFAGCKLGQTAGVLGVLLEGSVSIGVFVASVATASYTAQQIQGQMEERRVLTMGENGTSRKVLLVRPNIQIEPVWDQILIDAKRSVPKNFPLLPAGDAATRQRYRRESDIVEQTEDEIPTDDKVLLLVSRALNDKSSLPGHVYRYLIEKFKERCKIPPDDQSFSNSTDITVDDDHFGSRGRRRRDDAHAVIKHVTATLLEVRPALGSSPGLTEVTATAVESLVFGQIYPLVFEEIEFETCERDEVLRMKISEFNRDRLVGDNAFISEPALQALRRLPSAHSAVEKLYDCVRFLESISDQFSMKSGSSNGHLCADSLLKMVCQHLLVVDLDHVNAEVAFLEEFARDEQLLRGREGYALVTLQASLHFLNMLSDLDEIFCQDTEEENIPIGIASNTIDPTISSVANELNA